VNDQIRLTIRALYEPCDEELPDHLRDALPAMHDIDVLAAPSVQCGTDFRQA
jgi:hypothetical protein